MIEPDPDNIAAALRRHAAENEQATSMDASVHSEGPGIALNVQQWARAAPTLPAGALMSIARAGVNINSDVGQWLITNAVPSSMVSARASQSPEDQIRYLSDPNNLNRLKSMNLGLATDELQSAGSLSAIGGSQFDQSTNPQPMGTSTDQSAVAGQSLSSSNPTVEQGVGNIGAGVDVARTGVREAGVVAQSGAEALGGALREQAAGLTKTVANIATGQNPTAGKTAGGVPYDPQQYIVPKAHVPGIADIPGLRDIPGIKNSPYLQGTDVGGSPINFGDQQALTDIPAQTTLGQQLSGKSVGHGILPGGPAVAAAQQAQRDSATVAGHALTPGRALASFVATPDSLAFRTVSGFADAYVNLHFDPALLATEQLTDAVKLAKTIAPVTGDAVTATADHLIDTANSGDAVNALRDWAGPSEPDLRTAIVKKLSDDPVSVRQLIDNPALGTDAKGISRAIVGKKAGLLSGLYDSVHPTNFQNFLVGPEGDRFFNTMSTKDFTDIGEKTGWTMDAKLQLALADATTPDEARQALQDHVSSISQIPTVGFHPLSGMRWNSILPTQQADIQDADSLLTRARQDLQLFKVPKGEWDNYLPDIVRSEGDYTKAYDTFTRIGDRGAQNILAKIPGYSDLVDQEKFLGTKVKALGDYVVPTDENQALIDRHETVAAQVKAHQDLASGLTNYFYEKGNDARLWHNAEIGGGAHLVDGLNPAGGMTAVDGPFSPAELLNRSIPTPGGIGPDGTPVTLRDIHRAVGTWAPLWNRPIIGDKFLDPLFRRFFVDGVADHLTDTMRGFATAHVGTAVRVIGSQGAGMAAAGVGDMSSNPLGLLGLVLNDDAANIRMTGDALINDIGPAQNKLAASVGQATNWRQELSGANKMTEVGWENFAPKSGTSASIDAWANRLSYASNQPLVRSVAQALMDGEGLDGVKQSVWDGELAPIRQQMIDSNVTWGKNIGPSTISSKVLVNRAQSDAWIDGWAKIIQTETANRDDLIKAIANNEIGPDITDQFKRQLKSVTRDVPQPDGTTVKQIVAPDVVTGRTKFDTSGPRNWLRRSVSALFSVTNPATRDWMLVPTVKRLYMAEAERLLPYLSEADAESWRGLAAAHGVELPDVEKDVTHTISLNRADQIALTSAKYDFQKIFYNPSSRSILTDQLRDIIPFANIVGNTMKRWASLVASNPKILRVVQMGVTDAEQSGWWNKDQYGKYQMSLTPGSAMNALTGVPFDLGGEASRLNIATQGWPSVGPVISLSAPAILQAFGQNSAAQTFLKYTDPYGDPTSKGDLLRTLAPGWFDKLATTGWLANVPLVNAIGGTPDQYQQRMLNQTAAQVLRYKLSTGHYDPSDKNAMEKLQKESLSDARYMYLIRGFAQFVLPVAPTFSPTQVAKDGSVVQQYLVSNDWNATLKANNNDSYKATLAFINKWGADNILTEQPFTRPLVYGLPTTAEAEAWKSQNGSFADKYSTVYGYFAPQQGGFDYGTYLKQIADGDRQPLKISDWFKLAEARLGNALYDQLRRQLPPSLNAKQQVIVSAYRAQLTKQYPGFNQDSLKLASDTAPQTITEFRGAIQDPSVKNTPLAKAIGQYFQIRDAVLTKQQQLGLSPTTISTSARASSLRDLLYKWGSQLATQVPEFANVWQSVFSYEVENQNTQDVAATG